MAEQYKDIVGQPISGMPDCYAVGPGDTGYPQGSVCRPQGNAGPAFRKEVKNGQYVWVHVGGNVASAKPLLGLAGKLRHLFGAPDRARAIRQNFGVPIERSQAIRNQFGVPPERSEAIDREFGVPPLDLLRGEKR